SHARKKASSRTNTTISLHVVHHRSSDDEVPHFRSSAIIRSSPSGFHRPQGLSRDELSRSYPRRLLSDQLHGVHDLLRPRGRNPLDLPRAHSPGDLPIPRYHWL